MTREQLAETQAKYIVKEMTMDDVTAKKFTATFCQFQKEIWALGPVLEKSLRAARTQKRSRLLQTGSLISQKILDLRKKYYAEYCKFLTQKQIERVYKLERRMMNHLYHLLSKGKTSIIMI